MSALRVIPRAHDDRRAATTMVLGYYSDGRSVGLVRLVDLVAEAALNPMGKHPK